ncbi:MAG: CotH kinase family protein [Myxococcales bacterium]|nr:CotH kinase family protein [Myxococcales bacterium]
MPAMLTTVTLKPLTLIPVTPASGARFGPVHPVAAACLSLWLMACTEPAPTATSGTSADSPDTATTDSVPGRDVGPHWAGPTQDDLFSATEVQRISLTIAPADIAKMNAALPERIWVSGTFSWAGMTLKEIGVRYKGNSSSQPNQKHKRGLLLHFGRFKTGQRLLGLRRLALDNGVQFGSVFSERLVGEVLAAEGVPASRSSWATVAVNGTNRGVFVVVERIDKSFLARTYGSTQGLLYKVHLGGPGAGLESQASASGFTNTFSPETSDTAEIGHGPLHTLTHALSTVPDDKLEAWMATNLDLEGFLKFTAVALYAGAFDQYTGFNAHNYYLHRDEAVGRWTYLPWDLDVGFADNAFGCIPVIDGWNAAWPLPATPRSLLSRIVSHPALLARYRVHADRILEKWFKPQRIATWLGTAHALLKTDLAQDPHAPVRITNPGVVGYPAIVADMNNFAAKRYAKARAELDAPKPTPPIKPKCGGGHNKAPAPGTLKDTAPTGLKLVSATVKGVTLSWTDHGTGAAGTVLQRCSGVGCDTFQNIHGMPGQGHETATDTQVVPGATYRYRVYVWMPIAGGTGSLPSNVVTAQLP